MSPKMGDQHVWLHQRWPPPQCCLCGHEALLVTRAEQIAALEAEVKRLKTKDEASSDAYHAGYREGQSSVDLSPFVALEKAADEVRQAVTCTERPEHADLAGYILDARGEQAIEALCRAVLDPAVQQAVKENS